LEFAIELLLDNGYPLELIFKKINDRIKTLIYIKRDPTHRTSADNNNDSINNKKFIVLLYINKITESISSTIDKTKFITGYRIINSLGKFIKIYKDTNDLFANNNVVYRKF